MPTNLTKSNQSNAIPTLVANRALTELRTRIPLASNINRDYEQDVRTSGGTVEVDQPGSYSANDKSQGSDVTRQNPSDSKISVPINNHKEVTFSLEDTAAIQAEPNLLNAHMENSIIALATAVEEDVAAQASNLTNKVNDGNSDLTLSDVRSARSTLSNNDVPSDQRFLALDTSQYDVFLGTDNLAFSERYGDNTPIQDGRFGKLLGFNAIDWNHANTNTTPSPNELENLAIHKNALTFVNRPLPLNGVGVDQSRVDYQGLSLRVTMHYDPNALATQVTVDILYGVSVLRDDHGVILASQTS